MATSLEKQQTHCVVTRLSAEKKYSATISLLESAAMIGNAVEIERLREELKNIQDVVMDAVVAYFTIFRIRSLGGDDERLHTE